MRLVHLCEACRRILYYSIDESIAGKATHDPWVMNYEAVLKAATFYSGVRKCI